MEKVIDEDKVVSLASIDTKEEDNYIILCNYAVENKKYKSLHSILQGYNYIIEPNYEGGEELSSSFIAYLYTLPGLNISVLQRYKTYTFAVLALHLLDLDEDYIPPFKRLISVYRPEDEIWPALISEMRGRMKYGLKDYNELIEYVHPVVTVKEEKKKDVLGPSNVLDRIVDNPNCNKGEGCHFYLCNHLSEEEEPKDWFTGSCQFCSTPISSRYDALRFPFHAGGWLGCYCSVYCVVQDRPDKQVGEKRTEEAMKKIIEEINFDKK